MKKMRNSIRGSVSILLILLMIPSLVLGSAVVDTSRIKAFESRLDSALNLAVNSVLSMYNDDLYERYGLFAITPDRDTVLEEVEKTLKITLEGVSGLSVYYSGSSELPLSRAGKLAYLSSDVITAPYSCIAAPDILERQILEYMKYRGPLNLGTGLAERFEVLGSVSEESEVTAAKLDYDESLSSIDSYARKTYESYLKYSEKLSASVFSGNPQEKYNELSAEMNELKTIENNSSYYLGICEGLALSGDKCEISGKEMFVLSSAELLNIAENTDYTALVVRLRDANYSTEYTAEDFQGLKDSFSSCRDYVELLYINKDRICEAFGLAQALSVYCSSMPDTERNDINNNAGYDFCSEMNKLAQSIISNASFVFSKAAVLSSFFKEMKKTVSKQYGKLYDETRIKAMVLFNVIKELEENAEQLESKLIENESRRQIWENTIDAMPEGTVKDQYRRQFESEAEFLSPEAVTDFIAEVEESFAFFTEIYAFIPDLPQKSDYESVLNENTVNEDSQSGKFLQKLREYWAAGKDEANTEVLDSVKSLAGTIYGSGEEEPGKFSEADINSCFDSISLMFDSRDVLLEAAMMPEFDSSDNEAYSEAASESLWSISDFLSGFGDFAMSCTEDILEIEYIMEMFSCAADNEYDTTLNGRYYGENVFFGEELEYIIFGSDTAAVNTATAGASIFAIRFALNTVYAMTNTEMRELALVPATAAAGWTGFGVPLIQNVILVCWAMAESGVDIYKLEKGDSTALYKTKETWFLGFGAFMDAAEGGLDAAGSGEGFLDKLNSFSYRDYLTLFLIIAFLADRDAVLERCVRLMQINVSAYDTDFRITEAMTAAYCECKAAVSTSLPVYSAITAAEVTGFCSFGDYGFEIDKKKFCSY